MLHKQRKHAQNKLFNLFNDKYTYSLHCNINYVALLSVSQFVDDCWFSAFNGRHFTFRDVKIYFWKLVQIKFLRTKELAIATHRQQWGKIHISRSREHNSSIGTLHINFIAINIYEQFDN